MSDLFEYLFSNYEDELFLRADGSDEAIIGFEESSMKLIYSVSKCIQILCRDMNEVDAIEYFSFNVQGAYVGEKTPIWCMDYFN